MRYHAERGNEGHRAWERGPRTRSNTEHFGKFCATDRQASPIDRVLACRVQC